MTSAINKMIETQAPNMSAKNAFDCLSDDRRDLQREAG